jgi:hypothetical protein
MIRHLCHLQDFQYLFGYYWFCQWPLEHQCHLSCLLKPHRCLSTPHWHPRTQETVSQYMWISFQTDALECFRNFWSHLTTNFAVEQASFSISFGSWYAVPCTSYTAPRSGLFILSQALLGHWRWSHCRQSVSARHHGVSLHLNTSKCTCFWPHTQEFPH